MRHKATDERVLEILAEGVLNASPEEIKRVAIASGIDVAALEKKVREKIAERTAIAEDSQRGSFSVGETVALRSDPKRIGVVTAVTPSNRETRYSVFIEGRMEMLYASQLQPADLAPTAIQATSNELNARLTALQIAAPSLANLYSLQAGRVDFIPYQFRRNYRGGELRWRKRSMYGSMHCARDMSGGSPPAMRTTLIAAFGTRPSKSTRIRPISNSCRTRRTRRTRTRAGARFELTKDAVIFHHNGRPFERNDIEGITGIGNTTKTKRTR
ncbi:hypothetical protein [Bradyrhizobium sp. RDI18]|uniref:hypothetical protein n=1 Tax=Bradyrhizobium sp. RDI18 TaxID=3367400 RepID=UPI003716025B